MDEDKNNKIIPVYTFAEGQDEVEPIKRKILKTMEVTEEFTAWDVLQYVAKMDKAIADKEAELEGLKSMKKAYLEEMVHVEEQTEVNKLQEEHQMEVARNVEHANEHTGMDKQEVPSPYVEEVADGPEKND